MVRSYVFICTTRVTARC